MQENYASTMHMGFFLDNFTSFLILYSICSTVLICFFYLSKQESYKREKFTLNKTVQRFTEWRVLIEKKIIIHVRGLHNLYLQLSLTSISCFNQKRIYPYKVARRSVSSIPYMNQPKVFESPSTPYNFDNFRPK